MAPRANFANNLRLRAMRLDCACVLVTRRAKSANLFRLVCGAQPLCAGSARKLACAAATTATFCKSLGWQANKLASREKTTRRRSRKSFRGARPLPTRSHCRKSNTSSEQKAEAEAKQKVAAGAAARRRKLTRSARKVSWRCKQVQLVELS